MKGVEGLVEGKDHIEVCFRSGCSIDIGIGD
jgi:hypothetical protein